MKIHLYIISFLIFFGCSKDNMASFPSVKVDLKLDVYNELRNLGVGGVLTITPDTTSTNSYFAYINYQNPKIPSTKIAQRVYGNGILLYCADLNYYIAYDLTCTYRAKQDYCALIVRDRETLPICPCCKSVFMIINDGDPATGSKAVLPLKKYSTIIVNNGAQLVISN